MKRYTKEEIKLLRKYYPKRGIVYCANKLDRSHGSISWKAHHLGLKVDEDVWYENIVRHCKKGVKHSIDDTYNVNPHQFIDNHTKESTYILGFLWADGFISDKDTDNRHSITVECLKDDIDLLYPIFTKTGKWSISYRNRPGRKAQARISTNNYPLSKYLLKYGYGPRTFSSANEILKKIPKALQYMWFRGLVDGDGCFYINKGNSCFQFSIAGAYNQDWKYVEDLLNKIEVRYAIQRRKQKQDEKINNSSVIRVTNRKDIIKIGEYIYEGFDCDKIGLIRKYEKYSAIKSTELNLHNQIRIK